MSMIISFFVVPNVLIQEIEKGNSSVIDLVKYVKEVYELDETSSEKKVPPQTFNFKDCLDLYYYPTFGILETIYNAALYEEIEVPIIGRQPLSEEEVDILLKEYVGYAAGFLSCEDIKKLYNELANLPFEKFVEKIIKKHSIAKEELYKFIAAQEGGLYKEKDIIEGLPFLKEYYDEFVSYLQKLINLESKEKLGLFVAID